MKTSLSLGEGLTREYLFHHLVCPKSFDADDCLIVAAAPEAIADDALIQDAVEDIAHVYRVRRSAVRIESASREEVERLIERLTTRAEREIQLSCAELESGDDLADATTDVRHLANQPPVVRYVNLLVRDAFDAGASDIHLEAMRDSMAARFRLDGVLQPAPEPPAAIRHAVISRIKLLAELDIAERRRPQDGRIRVRLESRELDLRVSTVPTMFGESVVLRLLDHGGRPVELGQLGMPSAILERVAILAARPHGMLLVTGPTGSGKTTTLYACLQSRDAGSEKLITVEDPIEYQLTGIAQVPVHRQTGVTFATVLRSILRQDPDVVMVGEMRDRETAEIAVQAAMTGHLVFSTLHTNDSVGSISRLLDLGIPEYLVAATVEGVLAQRLVRRVCRDCAVAYTPAKEALALLARRYEDMSSGTRTHRGARKAVTFRRGAGCPACRGTGFRGRMGVFELMSMADAIKDAIVARAPRRVLRDLAREGGMRSMGEDGFDKVEAGLTTAEEVMRVVQE